MNKFQIRNTVVTNCFILASLQIVPKFISTYKTFSKSNKIKLLSIYLKLTMRWVINVFSLEPLNYTVLAISKFLILTSLQNKYQHFYKFNRWIRENYSI